MAVSSAIVKLSGVSTKPSTVIFQSEFELELDSWLKPTVTKLDIMKKAVNTMIDVLRNFVK